MTKQAAHALIAERVEYTARQVRMYIGRRDSVDPDTVRLPRLTAGAAERILSLIAWRDRYQISMSDILDCLILHFFPPEGRRKRTPGTLGISLVSLTGNAAEKHLEEEVVKHPAWQAAERERLRGFLVYVKPVPRNGMLSPETFWSTYEKAADGKRSLIAQQESDLAKRAFRRSPFRGGVTV